MSAPIGTHPPKQRHLGRRRTDFFPEEDTTRDSNSNPIGYKPRVIATLLAGRLCFYMDDEMKEAGDDFLKNPF
ncbi:hypothetical protein TNCV_4301031 [Trichonephila clavipes]|nr:hypothetical protein TNCV_4301031 [Trichonephila clavipes]